MLAGFAAIGFVLGTALLLGPVRWMTTALRARGVSQASEDWAVRGAIIALIVASAGLSWVFARWAMRVPSGRAMTALGVLGVLAAGTMAVWMNPRLVNRTTMLEPSRERFVFGAYPDAGMLQELQRQGFDGVITLLHPAVVPFEPRLLAMERAAAQAAGITLIEAPMLPWVSDNAESIARIREVAARPGGRYYVHCYLGKDRINVVRRIIGDPSLSGRNAAQESGARAISSLPALERGSIYHLEDSVLVGPFPTDEEWVGYVLGGQVRQVLSLLDPGNRDDTLWLGKERRLADQYRIPVEIQPVASFPYDPAQAVAAALRARRLRKPLFVHGFRTESAAVEGFVMAWRTGLPPLPPSLFVEPMQGGPVRVIGANLAVGDRPRPADFGSYLQRRGIRGVVYVGAASSAEGRQDRGVAESIRLPWTAVAPEAVAALVSSGGPWYVYGPGLAAILGSLEQGRETGLELGKTVPSVR